MRSVTASPIGRCWKNALTHRSFLNEAEEKGIRDNERLEFFGDAVIDFFLSNVLLERFPDSREGELTRIRASLVGEENLARSCTPARSRQVSETGTRGGEKRRTGKEVAAGRRLRGGGGRAIPGWRCLPGPVPGGVSFRTAAGAGAGICGCEGLQDRVPGTGTGPSRDRAALCTSGAFGT